MKNQELSKIFFEISEYLRIQDDLFRPRAYERVSETLISLNRDVEDIYKEGGTKALEEIPGVGKAIAEKIEEYLKTGKVRYLSELKKKIPVDVAALSAVEGLGPKKIKRLYKELGIKTIDDLDKAVVSGKIRTLKGFGEKSEQRLAEGIAFLKTAGGRFILGFVYDDILEINNRIAGRPGVFRAEIAGSARRMKETIGDLDILAVMKLGKEGSAERVMDYFVSMPEVSHIYSKGETRSSVRLSSGMDVDLRILESDVYGAGMMYFTGSKDHNVELRKIAIRKGWKLNEYGLFRRNAAGEWKKFAGETEEEIYKALDIQFVPPEIRENIGEVRPVGGRPLPKLVGYDDLLGDLQIQTRWSDGENTIEDYVEAAIKIGYRYILITDHSRRLTVAGGLDEDRLDLQAREIDKINERLSKRGVNFRVLKGIECDILKDGSLDLPDKALSKLDLVGASIHSYFNLPIAEQTRRLRTAMESKHVDIIFHPTTRQINQRKAIELDMSGVIRGARETGTALEIDGYPDRLDLKDEYIRLCVDAEIKLTVDSDAHSVNHLKYARFGIAQARRGFATRKDIANTRSVDECLKILRKD